MSDLGFLQVLLEKFGQFPEAEAVRICEFAASWMSHENRESKDRLFAVCESPMERQFLLGAFMINEYKLSFRYVNGANSLLLFVNDVDGDEVFSGALRVQEEVIDWETDANEPEIVARVDFALVDRNSDARIAIEIDGHEFHEKTKEQAARDKARDRRVTKCGYPVIRFTGSEVFANAFGCLIEAIETLQGLSNAFGLDAETDSEPEPEQVPALPAASISIETVEAAAE